jgi:peptidyl-prolyl cis-trans isomerase SurA
MRKYLVKNSKYSKKTDSDSRLIARFSNNKDTLLTITEGTWYKGDNAEIDKLQWITGSQPFTIHGFPSIIVIQKIINPVPLIFEKVQGEMITGYQKFLEDEWMRQLMENYTVKIDSLILKEVKKSTKNE